MICVSTLPAIASTNWRNNIPVPSRPGSKTRTGAKRSVGNVPASFGFHADTRIVSGGTATLTPLLTELDGLTVG
jgi:hypothetical protein